MSNEKIDNFVDLLFNFDMQELENETKFLENYKKIQQENQQLKEVIEKVREYTNDKLFDDYTYYSYEDLKQNINEILDKGVKDEQESKNN